MPRTRFILAVALMIVPSAVCAADIELACALTDEDIVFVPRAVSASAPAPLSAHRNITERTDLAIKQSVLFTPAGSPCDRISGAITSTHVDVTCSFPPGGIGRAAFEIQIDLERGSITETWSTIEHDGSQSHFYKHGSCTAAEAPRIADRSSPATQPPAQIAVQQTTFLRATVTGSRPPGLH